MVINMGLDMYLYGIKRDKKEDVFEKQSGKWKEICYWRKANQIHKWFNINFIKKQDPWGLYEVDEKSVQGLLLLCKLLIYIKDNPDSDLSWVKTDFFEEINDPSQDFWGITDCSDLIAYALLPPDNLGCCFGRGVVDEEYWEDIKDTIKQLESALNQNYDVYYYRASW